MQRREFWTSGFAVSKFGIPRKLFPIACASDAQEFQSLALRSQGTPRTPIAPPASANFEVRWSVYAVYPELRGGPEGPPLSRLTITDATSDSYLVRGCSSRLRRAS